MKFQATRSESFAAQSISNQTQGGTGFDSIEANSSYEQDSTKNDNPPPRPNPKPSPSSSNHTPSNDISSMETETKTKIFNGLTIFATVGVIILSAIAIYQATN